MNESHSATLRPLEKPLESPLALLLLEPDVFARLTLAEYLRGCGYLVAEACTVSEALEILRSDAQIGIVLAEIHDIGSMTGFEFAHLLHREHPGIEVILTSSLANAADKCHQLCEHLIVKAPHTPQEILHQIKLLHEKRRKHTKSED